MPCLYNFSTLNSPKMSLEIREITTKTDIKKFVNLQFELYKNNKFWVPPIKTDELKYINPEHNPAFKSSDAKFYLALKNGKAVGRIGAVVSQRYNQKVGKKYVRFTKPEFIDDYEISQALIAEVEKFGKKRGMTTIHGPLGFTNLDNQGLLIDGFTELQSIGSVYHLPYYKTHFEKLGFKKENDWIEFELKLTDTAINKANRGAKIITKRYGYEILHFSTAKEVKQYAPKVFEIINEAFETLPYVVPFENELKNYYINKYFSILNPRYVKIVKKDNELVGFQLAIPSMSKAMQRAKGHLFPFGIFHLLKANKHNNLADLMLTGVRKKHQKSGVAVILFSEIQNALSKDGIYTFETTGVFENNSEVLSNWKSYNSRQHKRRRCYVKSI